MVVYRLLLVGKLVYSGCQGLPKVVIWLPKVAKGQPGKHKGVSDGHRGV